MNIQELIDKVIPPRDLKHRNGFNNIPLIDKLEGQLKSELEEALTEKLADQSADDLDPLLIDTLGYMKSREVHAALLELLRRCSDNKMRIVLATAIFEICEDEEVVPIAIDALRQINAIKGPYRVSNLTSLFYYLAKFEVDEINELIDSFSDNEDILIAYNAKRALEI